MLDTKTPCLLSTRAGMHLGRTPVVGPAREYHKLPPGSMIDPHYCWHYEVKYGKFDVPRIAVYCVWQNRPHQPARLDDLDVRRRHEFSIVMGEVQGIIDALGQAQELAGPHAVAYTLGLKMPKVRRKRGQIALAEGD